MPKLITTLGHVGGDQLGMILPHEHIFVDLGANEEPHYLTAEAGPAVELMAPELEKARAAGVSALVECTPLGVGRRADIVRAVSQAADFPIVVPTGIYREPWVPHWVYAASEDEIRDWMVGELTGQIEDSGVQAGWIKVSAGDDGLTATETKILQAAALAGKETGAVIGSHTIRGRVVLDQLAVIEEQGCAVDRFIWIHTQAEPDLDLHLEVARCGPWIEYDGIGSDDDAFYTERILRVLEAGLGHRLLISHDRGWYDPSQPGGGVPRPFTYISQVFLPKLRGPGNRGGYNSATDQLQSVQRLRTVTSCTDLITMKQNREPGWYFVDGKGTFALPDADRTSYLYFPLVNEQGMVSVVTPTLHGDIKTDHDTYLTLPVSVEDLHISRAARNLWVRLEGQEAWSATGNSAAQVARHFHSEADHVHLKAGFLWHEVARTHRPLGVRAEITSFVPSNNDAVELMGVVLTNVSSRPIPLTVTAAIPVYGRSADRLRDHRHVTSLLQRIRTHPYGVLVCPSLAFDERGHHPNETTYVVLGAEADGTAPTAFFPVLADFVGEGGTLDWPQAVIDPRSKGLKAGAAIDGYEAMGGLRFRTTTLAPGERCAYVIILGILHKGTDPGKLVERYGSRDRFDEELERTKAYWERKLAGFRVDLGDARFNGWMKWVALQPILRRICGNSFLPYHDYGRGGRGWRDLWQDLLALLLMNPVRVEKLLLGNFAGVRMDGSNATIVGTAPGEFKADRNDIPRVWMDHGAWPLLTTQLYIDQTGDLPFLLRKQTYFRDSWIDRGQGVDVAWEETQGTVLKAADGSIYRGTVLEHLLIQHLTVFFNVGKHNIMRLEGGDWNDGLDMARKHGESAAFTALYAGNLRDLGRLVTELASIGVTEITLAGELKLLLDTLTDPVDYGDPTAKQARLARYFEVVRHGISGKKVIIPLADLASDVFAKASWLTDHLRGQEWVEDGDGYGWFNGYYDEEGHQVEGEHPDRIRMTLAGQTFSLMGGVATAAQAPEIVRSVDRYLFTPEVGGPRLNTDFGRALPDASTLLTASLGRAFGFAFGHKENGAMFSHMAVMYANALYQRGLARAGHRVLRGIYRHTQDFTVSRMYPGIPEYVNPRGRGMYPYLTGSASWYLLTMITQVFGIRGLRGDLVLEPKLLQEQFDESGTASLRTVFAGRLLDAAYINSDGLDYRAYCLGKVRLNDTFVPFERVGSGGIVRREVLERLLAAEVNRLEVVLTKYEGDGVQEDDDLWP